MAEPFSNTTVHASGETPALVRLDTGTMVLRYGTVLSVFLQASDLGALEAQIAAFRAQEAAAEASRVAA